MPAMNSAQRRHLQQRIDAHFHALRQKCYADSDDDPAAVVRARAIIEKHSKQRQVQGARRDAELRKAMREAESVLLFAEPAKALEAVMAFEKFKLPR